MENHDTTKGIEWRPNDLITIDSDTQDQEWAVVNTIGISMSYAKGICDDDLMLGAVGYRRVNEVMPKYCFRFCLFVSKYANMVLARMIALSEGVVCWNPRS